MPKIPNYKTLSFDTIRKILERDQKSFNRFISLMLACDSETIIENKLFQIIKLDDDEFKVNIKIKDFNFLNFLESSEPHFKVRKK